MREKPQDQGGESRQLGRRSFPIYDENPSISDRFPTRIISGNRSKLSSAYMVTPETGEIVGRGSFGFIEEKEVDNETFVKVYLDGIKRFGQLSKSGATLFEYIYRQISGMAGKDKDTVMISFYLAQKWQTNLTKPTYYRGVAELLEKEFVYRSGAADVYFVNVRLMFNGDRLVLAQAYRRKGSPNQIELPLNTPQIPPSTSKES